MNNPHDDRSVTIGQLKNIAAGLIGDGDALHNVSLYDGTNEYLRGMAELIGRALLDVLNVGDDTVTNATYVAQEIIK